jgi:hypothetical protein
MWTEPLHQARIARIFDHDRMKKVSVATIKSQGSETDSGSAENRNRKEINRVAQTFVILQRVRHDADYNLEAPLDPADAKALVEDANEAFVAWDTARNSEAAKEYLFSMLFKERERI